MRTLINLIFVGLLAGCGMTPADSSKPSVVIEPAFPHLRFEQPVDLQHSPDGTNRLFVVEQRGVIRVFDNDPQTKTSRVFLDINKEVRLGHSEEGMLGLTFHPQFKNNGYFFVYYIATPRRSVIARFKVDPSGQQADPKSEFVILEVEQPYGNHNGGQIAFGPDGYLYIALGDGGSAGDPHNHGQDTKTLLGSILRIDVDHTSSGKNYTIPSGNPFVGNTRGDAQEIYAYGLRNPWRFSFDSKTGKLWAGDVGQDKPYEEVDIIEKGGNYGWNIMEGFQCFKPAVDCNKEGLKLPIWEYSVQDGRSITGGFVYRGKHVPSLEGYYLYADFVSGRVWALSDEPLANHLLVHNSNLYPSSFGVDQAGELYICSFDGTVYGIRSKK